jgi:curved DNA-binding protein CbpA
MPDPYETLGLERSASLEQIKKAYRRGCSEAHPDKHGGDGRRQQEVNDAYAILSDPARRASFDASGDTTPRGRLMENARAILANEFSKLMDQEFAVDPISLLRTALEGMKRQAFADRQTQSQRIRLLERKERALRGPAADNFLAPVIAGKLAQARAQLIAIDQAMESFELAAGLIQAYAWALEEDPSAGFAQFFAVGYGQQGGGYA